MEPTQPTHLLLRCLRQLLAGVPGLCAAVAAPDKQAIAYQLGRKTRIYVASLIIGCFDFEVDDLVFEYDNLRTFQAARTAAVTEWWTEATYLHSVLLAKGGQRQCVLNLERLIRFEQFRARHRASNKEAGG